MTVSTIDFSALARETFNGVLRCLKDGGAWGDSAESVILAALTQSHASGHAKALEEAATWAKQAVYEGYDSVEISAALRRAADIRALASSDPAPRDQVAEDECPHHELESCFIAAKRCRVCGETVVPLDPAPAHPVEPGLAAQEVERLRDLVTCLLENEPDDYAADGVTVLEVWRQAARAALSAPRPSQPKGEKE